MKTYLLELTNTYSLEKKLGVVAYTDYKLRLMQLDYEILLQEQYYELVLKLSHNKTFDLYEIEVVFQETTYQFYLLDEDYAKELINEIKAVRENR